MRLTASLAALGLTFACTDPPSTAPDGGTCAPRAFTIDTPIVKQGCGPARFAISGEGLAGAVVSVGAVPLSGVTVTGETLEGTLGADVRGDETPVQVKEPNGCVTEAGTVRVVAAPKLVTLSPADGQAVSVLSRGVAVFSEPVVSADPGALDLCGMPGKQEIVEGSLRFTPDAQLAYDTKFVLTLDPSKVHFAAGLSSCEAPFTTQFVTRNEGGDYGVILLAQQGAGWSRGANHQLVSTFTDDLGAPLPLRPATSSCR